MSAYHVLCPSLYETTAAMCSFFYYLLIYKRKHDLQRPA